MEILSRHFKRMGADLIVLQEEHRWDRVTRERHNAVTVNVRSRVFEITRFGETDIKVVNVDAPGRHLLLQTEVDGVKSKFLCGHDERHWFVAAVPESAGARDVRTAKEALKPTGVRIREDRAGVKARHRNRRRNKGSTRQGEWFFVPAPDLVVEGWRIRKNEPFSRGRGKSHHAQEAYRSGGEAVYVSRLRPLGVTLADYARLRKRREFRGVSWTPMRRNANLYVRGRISHPDHATIILRGWHLVLMNTEGLARAMADVAFLD